MDILSKKTDEQLLNSYLNGSEASLDVLIKRHKNTVMAYIYKTTRNVEVAEDIFQDTFIKVIHNLKLGKYKENGKFLSWVIRISHNMTIDYFRRNKRAFISKDVTEYDLLANEAIKEEREAENVVDVELKKKLYFLVTQLPTEQRDVVHMRYFWGLSFKEIAENTGVSINTSLGRMRYALINLRKNIDTLALS